METPRNPQDSQSQPAGGFTYSAAQLVYILPVSGAGTRDLFLSVSLHSLSLILTEFGVFAVLVISHHDFRRDLEGGHAYNNHRAYAR
jgi:hypothetical protein